MILKRTVALLILVIAVASIFAQIPPTDKKGDPFKDLQKAEEAASKEQKRILVIVGGDWCEWCARLDNFINSDKELVDILNKNYVVVKVYSEKDLSPNGLFLGKYATAPGFPHIYVLSAEGKLLESKRTDSLEQGESYDKAKVREFLASWASRK